MRLVIVCNKNSSRFAQIKAEVLDCLDCLDSARAGYEVFEVDNNKDVNENAEDLRGELRDGDRVVSAGGDGTAAIAVNALADSSGDLRDLTLAVLPYGNFNDTAAAFGRPSLEQIADNSATTTEAYPLELKLDGKHKRYSLCYFTIGMFAESTRIFDEKATREKLKNYRGSRLVLSIKTLFEWWLKNRRKRFLPREFTIERVRRSGRFRAEELETGGLEARRFAAENREVIEVKGATDYMAVNTTRVAKMMKNRRKYYGGAEFLSAIGRNAGFFGICGFMARSVLGQIPGRASGGDTLTFAEPEDIEIQADGEFFAAKGVRMVEVGKGKKGVRVLTLSNTY